MIMRVCFIIPDLNDGGAQVQCIRLLEALQDREDVDLLLIYLHDGVHSHRLGKARYRVERVPVSSNFDPRNILRLHRILGEFGPDVLFTWLHAADVYGYFLKKLNPRVSWLMAERDSAYPRHLRYLLREKLGRHADAIACNSSSGCRYWTRLRAKGRLFTVPNILQLPTSNGPRAGTVTVAAVGRLEPQKNPLETVAAFCQLAQSRADIRFQIIGDGSLSRDVEAIIAAAGLSARIKMLGFRNDAQKLIREADVLVSLSLHEGAPNVVLEAISLQTVVVVSDIPEHRELLGDQYPYYVSLNAAAADSCAAQITAALAVDAHRDLYSFARPLLAEMSPAPVGARYMAIFRSLES